MIMPDLNLLIFAHDRASAKNDVALRWWRRALDAEEVFLSWITVWGFIRVTTGAHVKPSLEIRQAKAYVDLWLSRPNVSMIEPGRDHLNLSLKIAEQTQVSATKMSDVFLAALAIESAATLCTDDSFFSRIDNLSVINPLISDP